MSYNRLQRKQFWAFIILVAGFLVLYGGIKLYRSHPVCGTVLLVLVGAWLLRQVVRFVRALCDDPLLRAAPYREIEMQKEDSSFTKK